MDAEGKLANHLHRKSLRLKASALAGNTTQPGGHIGFRSKTAVLKSPKSTARRPSSESSASFFQRQGAGGALDALTSPYPSLAARRGEPAEYRAYRAPGRENSARREPAAPSSSAVSGGASCRSPFPSLSAAAADGRPPRRQARPRPAGTPALRLSPRPPQPRGRLSDIGGAVISRRAGFELRKSPRSPDDGSGHDNPRAT